MSILEVKNIEKSFNKTEVLKGISFEMKEGEVLAIIGRSGSGKSTLLRCLNFLERAEKGEILLNGEYIVKSDEDNFSIYPEESELCKKGLNFGMVFQNFNLFPHKSILNNLTLAPILVNKISKDEAEKNARAILKRVGLSEKEKNYPFELSGGQQQRAAIARALCMKPAILCFDEPTSALDPELTGEVLKVIRSLKEDNTTMIVVTHEIAFARDVADKIMFMDDGQIIEIGESKEIFYNPKHPRTKEFMQSILKNE